MKYLLPWKYVEKIAKETLYARFNLTDNEKHWWRATSYVWQDTPDGKWYTVSTKKYYDNMKEAMNVEDKHLLKIGYVLITEGKEDMYKVLI